MYPALRELVLTQIACPVPVMRQAYHAANPAAASEVASAKERRALLFEDFGASKKKRALAASAANLVSADQALGADSLASWMNSGGGGDDDKDGGGGADATDVALAEGRKQLLPPFDLKTSDPAKVYDLQACFASGRGALRRQLSSLQAAGGGDWVANLEGQSWPRTSVAALRRSGSNTEGLCDALLLKHLMALHLKQPKRFGSNVKEEAAALGMPAELLGYDGANEFTTLSFASRLLLFATATAPTGYFLVTLQLHPRRHLAGA